MSSMTLNGRVSAQNPPENVAPFRATFASEWAKLVGLRATWILLAMAAILSIGVTALLTWAIGWSWNEWTEADKAVFDPVMTSFAGLLFAGILGIVISVNLVTKEYASGMIRLTMQVTPNRTRVLLAKIAAVTLFLLVPMVVITFATIQAGQWVLGAYDVPTSSVFEGETFWMLLATGVSGLFYPIMAVAIAFILRTSAATITTLLVVMFLPALFGGAFPRTIQENVLAWLPGSAIDALTMGHLDPDYPMYLDKPYAAVAVVAWMVGLLVLSSRILNRRDV